MTELSISVTIANREYPLKVTAGEEVNIRKAVQVINDSIKEYAQSYGMKDKQDYLAMCALQYVTEVLKSEDNEENPNEVNEDLNKKIDSLDKLIAGVLEKN
jgi:cell division protein ZapA